MRRHILPTAFARRWLLPLKPAARKSCMLIQPRRIALWRERAPWEFGSFRSGRNGSSRLQPDVTLDFITHRASLLCLWTGTRSSSPIGCETRSHGLIGRMLRELRASLKTWMTKAARYPMSADGVIQHVRWGYYVEAGSIGARQWNRWERSIPI